MDCEGVHPPGWLEILERADAYWRGRNRYGDLIPTHEITTLCSDGRHNVCGGFASRSNIRHEDERCRCSCHGKEWAA